MGSRRGKRPFGRGLRDPGHRYRRHDQLRRVDCETGKPGAHGKALEYRDRLGDRLQAGDRRVFLEQQGQPDEHHHASRWPPPGDDRDQEPDQHGDPEGVAAQSELADQNAGQGGEHEECRAEDQSPIA